MTLPVSLWLTGGMRCTEYHLVISPLVWVQCIAITLYVCLSLALCVHSYISKTMSKLHEFSVHVTCGCCLVLLWQQCSMLCSSRFVNALMFCHNGLYGAWHWQYIPGHHAGEAVINFKHILQGVPHYLTLSSFTITANCAPGWSSLCMVALFVYCFEIDCFLLFLDVVVTLLMWCNFRHWNKMKLVNTCSSLCQYVTSLSDW